ncbi:hypothetical protein E27107_90019 [Elizabethkingia anophelis]|nr:hypothetical protein E18064_60169 [Elizabethkingia anophelis]CDN79931.1 hypothetical protein E27107_90019 [Elizabethkingia anophelis]
MENKIQHAHNVKSQKHSIIHLFVKTVDSFPEDLLKPSVFIIYNSIKIHKLHQLYML